MDAPSINLEKINLDINNIVMDIKSAFDPDQNNMNIFMPERSVAQTDLESACKFFGCGADK